MSDASDITPNATPLAGTGTILILEGIMAIALDLEQILQGAGASKTVIALTIEEAMAALDAEPIGLAVIDILAGTQETFPFAQRLLDQNIRFVFVSGYSRERLSPDYARIDFVEKPVIELELLSAIASTLAQE